VPRRRRGYGPRVSARELVVLGTASQAPTRERNHVGFALRWDADVLLFDPGEGTQRQMVHAGVASPRITRICVTHAHADHNLGLPGVLSRMGLDGVRGPVPLHGPAAAAEHLALLRRVVADGGAADVDLSPLDAPDRQAVTVATTPAYTLTARALDHRVPALGYRLDEPDGRRLLPDRLAAAGIAGPDVGRLQAAGQWRGVTLESVSEPRPGQSFAFVMDTRVCDAAYALAAGVDLLVIESTFLHRDAALAEQYAHLTARQAATVALEAGVRRLVLTHFSQRYADPEELAAEAREVTGDAVEVLAPRDLDVVAVPPRRR
jgi:ribonuclease Z